MPRKKPISERLLLAWRKRFLVDINRPFDRICAWFDMLILDHGLVRAIYNNRYTIAPGVERANHPVPWQLQLAARRGLKTIINLRGESLLGSVLLEQRACARLGIQIVNYRMKSRQLPTRDQVLGIVDLFQSIEYPVLIHCKSGADRAGLMAALYLILHRQTPIKLAQKQLALKYGHIRAAKTGVLDFLFDSYLRSGHESFHDWVMHDYDPESLQQGFRPNGWINWAVDRILGRE